MTLTPQNVVVWHDKTPDQHKALVDKWSAKNFRMMSLSLYGATLLPFFAAVMVKRAVVIENKQVGPLDQAGMQKAIDRLRKGWGPAIITATGPSSSALFAGVFTPMDSIPLARLNMTGKQFTAECGGQNENGNILMWADVFGTSVEQALRGNLGAEPEQAGVELRPDRRQRRRSAGEVRSAPLGVGTAGAHRGDAVGLHPRALRRLDRRPMVLEGRDVGV